MRLPFNRHPYLVFRIRLASAGLQEFIASLKSSFLIITAAFGPLVLGLMVFAALPAMYAPTLHWPLAICVVAAHSLLLTAPLWLLRARILPTSLLEWARTLPVPRRMRLLADMASAASVMGPVTLCCTASAGYLLVQWPRWLRPVWPSSVIAMLAALATSWTLAIAVLAYRRRPVAQRTVTRTAAIRIEPYAARPARQRWFVIWLRVLWLPCWRAGSGIGVQQTALFVLGLCCMAAWMWPATPTPHAIGAAASSILLVLLTDRGHKAVNEQLLALRPLASAWPLAPARLAWYARCWSLLPGLALLSAWAALACSCRSMLGAYAAPWYFAMAAASQLAIVGLGGLKANARVGLVVFFIVGLCAIGSEVWK
jgi:hypothetical protein